MKEAIKEETRRFETFYLWLEESMPQIFFKEIYKEIWNWVVTWIL